MSLSAPDTHRPRDREASELRNFNDYEAASELLRRFGGRADSVARGCALSCVRDARLDEASRWRRVAGIILAILTQECGTA